MSEYEEAREAIRDIICGCWPSCLGCISLSNDKCNDERINTILSLPMIGVIAKEQEPSYSFGSTGTDDKNNRLWLATNIIKQLTNQGWRKLVEKEG